MSTLHIEHTITDIGTWKAAFDRLEGARRNAGVVRHEVQQPIDDARYVIIDLEFDSRDAARAFLTFLETNVWAVPANSPALVGSPRASILERVA
jgi:hypothetical protein